jgi:hypothetical protein
MSYPDSPIPWKQMHTSERLALIGATLCGLGIGLTLGGLFGLTYGVLVMMGGSWS